MPRLKGNRHAASNPMFTFSPAISFIANCEDQAEVDRLWETLSEGGEPGQCGWLKDKHGVSWQRHERHAENEKDGHRCFETSRSIRIA